MKNLPPLAVTDENVISEFLNRVFYHPLDFNARGALDEWIPQFTRAYQILTRLIRENPRILPLEDLVNKCLNLTNHSKMMYYASSVSVREMLVARGECAQAFFAPLLNGIAHWTPPPFKRGKKINLGVYLKVLTPYTETFAALPFFAPLNRQKFAVTVYVDQLVNSPLERDFIQRGGKVVLLNGALWEKLNQIRRDNVDILLITSNTSAIVNEAFFFGLFRAARRQLVQFCQPYTTGLPNVDGFIVGRDLQVRAADFTEKLYYLDGAGIAFSQGVEEAPPMLTTERASFGIPENQRVFISGANYFKLRYELLDCWARLLAATPNTSLVLFPFGPAWSNEYPAASFIERVHAAAARHHVAPTRIIISKPLPRRSDVRNLIGWCDIYLDSFPYSGATSLLDPFTLNLPIVAMNTPTVCGGQGAGMLRSIGLSELVAQDEDDYLRIAQRLATISDYYAAIRKRFAAVTSPPFYDLKTFGGQVEQVYQEVYAELKRVAH